jgi:hypothetical protein
MKPEFSRYRVLLHMLVVFTILARFESVSASANLKCKYIILDKTFLSKHQSVALSSSSNLLPKLFQITSGKVELAPSSNHVKIHEEDCLNKDSLDSVESALVSNRSVLYGVDLSSNGLDDSLLEKILTENPVFKYYSNKIKYLNVSENGLSRLNQLVTKSSLLNTLNLDVLVVDRNPKLDLTDLVAFVAGNSKLKLISANKCNFGEGLSKLTSDVEVSNLASELRLVYFGLSGNKLTTTLLTKLGSLFAQASIETLDLSHNKLDRILPSSIDHNRVLKLNLERNLIDRFEVNELVANSNNMSIEINLKSNFIRNTSLDNFKLGAKLVNARISIKIGGNPLVCDCNSMWMLEQSHKMAKLGRKNRSTVKARRINKLAKREIEEISSYHSIDTDPNLDKFMQRQKRLKSTTVSPVGSIANDGIIRILDLDTITCSFIDVQNFKNSNSTNSILSAQDQFEFVDYSSLDDDLRMQNIQVDSIRYKEKPVVASQYQDYMCLYEDHCKPNECDCCMFKHCHCRSICPRQCRCYFDSKLQQNIIDCSGLNLMDIPSNDEPIESATDMR